MGHWWLAASSLQYAHSCKKSPAEFFGKTSNHPGDLVPRQPTFGALWLMASPKTKITFERKEISDRQWNSIKYHRTADGNSNKEFNSVLSSGRDARTVWGPKLPTLKGTEASLSYLQCFLYLVCSLINVSVFHSVWLDIFWTDLIYAPHLLYPIIHQRALRFFTCFGYCKYCCNEHISIYIYTNKSFQNLGYILRRRIAVAYGRSTLNFLMNLSTYCFL